MRHHLTASRIGLARRCLWWARGDVEIPEDDAGSAAAIGTAFHQVAETEGDAPADEDQVDAAWRRLLLHGETLESLDLGDAERAQVKRLVASWREWMDRGLLTDVATEVPVALSLGGEGRRLERTTARDYSRVLDDELPGTVDVDAIWAPNDGTTASRFVGDYKTGRSGRLEDHLDQLTHLGTAIARADGETSVRVGVIHVTAWGVELDSVVLDEVDMAIHVEEVKALLLALEQDQQPAPGLHCEDLYCPARAVCPATRALLADARIAIEPRRRLPIVGPVGTNEQAHAILVAAPLLESWLADRVRAARAYADAHDGIRSPDGLVYRARPKTRETPRLDVAGALEALRATLGADADSVVKTKVSTSFDAIREAIQIRRKQGEKIPVKDTLEHVREALRGVGALKVSEFDMYEWADESPKKTTKKTTKGKDT